MFPPLFKVSKKKLQKVCLKHYKLLAVWIFLRNFAEKSGDNEEDITFNPLTHSYATRVRTTDQNRSDESD